MKTKHVNFEKQVLLSEKPIIVDFYADWCGPCRIMLPILDFFSRENGELVDVVKINIDTQPEIANQYHIMSVPTIVAFHEGKELKRRVGVTTNMELKRMVRKFI